MPEPPRPLEPDQFVTPLNCQKCNQIGKATWKKGTTVGELAKLLFVSLGFQIGSSTATSKPEIICSRCKTVADSI